LNVDSRREQLVRLLARRRRRGRLILVCLMTALACGVMVGVVAPQILIGGVPAKARPDVLKDVAEKAPAPEAAACTLALAERLALDPAEARANTAAWAAMSEDERRVLLDRYWRLAQMSPADQDHMLEQYALLRERSADRQEYLRTRAVRLREFTKMLSAQDLAVLAGMSDQDRAKRFLELWQARYGAW
jgi:hypothetical protein